MFNSPRILTLFKISAAKNNQKYDNSTLSRFRYVISCGYQHFGDK
jgi:hypothetical protein